MALVGSIAAAFLARKVLHLIWKSITGKEPPANPEHPEVTWPEAVSWAVASGAAIGLARLAAQKRVASRWHKATGQLPGQRGESGPALRHREARRRRCGGPDKSALRGNEAPQKTDIFHMDS